MLLPSFKSVSLFGPGEEDKIDFQDGGHGRHVGFPIGTILTIFYLQFKYASYQVSSQLPFRFRRRSEKYIFKLATISDQNDLSYF